MGNKSSNSKNDTKPKGSLKQTEWTITEPSIYELLVVGYLRECTKDIAINLEDIPTSITGEFMRFYASNKELIVKKDSKRTLFCNKSSAPYIYDKIHIKERGKLTINAWDTETLSGGTLYLICKGDMIIDNKGHINVDGKGYKGGVGGNTSGESYQRLSTQGTSANLGTFFT